MRYITIATIDGEKFKNAETEADNVDEAERKAIKILQKNYIGEINIIRTEELTAWHELLKRVL